MDLQALKSTHMDPQESRSTHIDLRGSRRTHLIHGDNREILHQITNIKKTTVKHLLP